MQKITARRKPSLTFAVGDSGVLELPNVDRYHRIWLHAAGTANVTLNAGTSAFTAQAPYALIRNVALTLSGYRRLGSTTLFNMSGYQASVWERVENPGFDDRSTPAIQAASALVNGNNAFRFSLLIPISVGETDFAGMLDLGDEDVRSTATLELRIDWASANSDVVTVAGGAVLNTLTATVDVETETFQFLRGEAARLGLRQDLIHQLTGSKQDVASTGQTRAKLRRGVLHLRDVFIFRNNGAFDDATFDTFDLVVNDSVRPYGTTAAGWRNVQRYRSVDKDLPSGTFALDRYWTRTWRDVYDATQLSAFEAEFNVTKAPAGTTDIATIQEVAVPTPQAAKAA